MSPTLSGIAKGELRQITLSVNDLKISCRTSYSTAVVSPLPIIGLGYAPDQKILECERGGLTCDVSDAITALSAEREPGTFAICVAVCANTEEDVEKPIKRVAPKYLRSFGRNVRDMYTSQLSSRL
ncbi:MAG TPA: hypothetical protein VIM21_03570 [Gemmatimonadaceae bacterium]